MLLTPSQICLQNCHADILLTSSKEEYFLELRNEIYLRRKPRDGNHDVVRAVLVFFANSDDLLEFFESKQMEDLKRETRVITEAIHPSEKRSAFAKATEQGAITLLIRDYGRGTDFKCFDTRMLDSGGTHVIQAFYSPEQSEEIQVKGRTARQGTKGSYRCVGCAIFRQGTNYRALTPLYVFITVWS
jgi:hypothetical protein